METYGWAFAPGGPPDMSFTSMKKALFALSLAFVLVSVWSDPSGSADAASSFLTSVGSFFSTAIDKASAFLRGLDN